MKNKMGISCNDTREEDLDVTLCSLLTDEINLFIFRELQGVSHCTEPFTGGPQALECLEKELTPFTDYTKELEIMKNLGRGGKHNSSNVKQLMQHLSDGKKLDLGKNTAP